MTAHELAEILTLLPDIEVGYFDSEGQLFTPTGFRLVDVDESDWHPLPHEKQTGELRPVIAMESGYVGDEARVFFSEIVAKAKSHWDALGQPYPAHLRSAIQFLGESR